MPLSQETFAAVVLEDIEGRWELYKGRLHEKPVMSFAHAQANWELLRQLMRQLDTSRYQVRQNTGHLIVPNGDRFIPDLVVVPVAVVRTALADARRLEMYHEPLPLVVEIWSPSTGAYDIDTKIPGYQTRRDAEIWRVHPFERAVTAWHLRPGGGYVETRHAGSIVPLVALRDIAIDLDTLFATP